MYFRVAAVNDSSIVRPCLYDPNLANCLNPGIWIELTTFIITLLYPHRISVTASYVPATSYGFSSYKNSSTYILDQIYKDEADTGLALNLLTAARAEYLPHVGPLIPVKLVYIYKNGAENYM